MADKVDSSLFDFSTDHPETGDDSHLFDFESPHPELTGHSLASSAQEPSMPIPEVGTGRAALVGAGQGATFGFGEELTAPFVAAAGMAQSGASKAFGTGENALPTLEGEDTLAKFQRLMQEYRDVARAEQQGAQDQHPVSYTAGMVAGGLAAPGLGAGKAMGAVGKAAPGLLRLPVRAAVGAGIGYGMGGLAGAGEAEGSLEERLPQALETAKTGGVIGAAIPVAGQAASTVGKLGSAIGEIPVIQDITKAFGRGANRNQNLITKAGRQEAADVGRKVSGEFVDDVRSLRDEVGGKIQKEIDMAQEAGEKVDLSQEIPEVLAKLQKIKAEGSKESAAYAAGVEAEIKKILKIKPEGEGYLGVAEDALPEGLSMPKTEAPSMSIDPKQAQDLKQVLSNYTPRPGMAPQEIAPAGVAKELRNATGTKLSELTEKLPELNEQYGAIKDSLKRMGINEKRLPEQIKEKINSVVTKLEKQNVSGDNAREIINDVMENLKTVEGGSEIAAKYQTEFADIVERLNLADKIIKGGESFSLTGTPKAAVMAASNLAGLAAGKTKIAPVATAAATFTKKVLSSTPATQSAIRYGTQGAEATTRARHDDEPYKLQRKVAAAAENAEPELLKTEAGNIRTKYGNQGQQLATILENMADKSKDARRALMFTILQNQAYRKMLGMSKEEEE